MLVSEDHSIDVCAEVLLWTGKKSAYPPPATT